MRDNTTIIITENRDTFDNGFMQAIFAPIANFISFILNIIAYAIYWILDTLLYYITELLSIVVRNPIEIIIILILYLIVDYLWSRSFPFLFPMKRNIYRIKKWKPEEKIIKKEKDPDFLDFYWEVEK